jgi:hypothetical protein
MQCDEHSLFLSLRGASSDEAISSDKRQGRVVKLAGKTGTGSVRGPIETLPGAMGIASSLEAPRNDRKRGCLIYAIRMSSGKMGIIPLTPLLSKKILLDDLNWTAYDGQARESVVAIPTKTFDRAF